MNTSIKPDFITVRILDRNYKVKCPQEKIAELQESAAMLDAKMREMIDTSKITSIDRVAVITALNLTHKLLVKKKQNIQYIDTMHKRILELQRKIELELTKQD